MTRKIKPLLEALSYNTRNTLTNNVELHNFAKKFLDNKMSALEKDVNHCLKIPYAPFPAILFCFSTIDLLGSLYAGQAAARLVRVYKAKAKPGKKNKIFPKTTANSAKYMKRYMRYSSESARLLQTIYRHKMVHLAQPKTIEDKNRIIAWRYYHNNRTRHLELIKF